MWCIKIKKYNSLNGRKNKIIHTFKLLFIIIKRRVFELQFIPQCIEINGIFVWGCTKGFRFKTDFVPLFKSSCCLTYLITSLIMQTLAKL